MHAHSFALTYAFSSVQACTHVYIPIHMHKHTHSKICSCTLFLYLDLLGFDHFY